MRLMSETNPVLPQLLYAVLYSETSPKVRHLVSEDVQSFSEQ